jgi:transglutaminase-like putative cysteine protease
LRDLGRAALATAVVLFAVVLLSGAFRHIAGVEAPSFEEENQQHENQQVLPRYDNWIPIDGKPPHVSVFSVVGTPRTWFLRGSVGEVYEHGGWRMGDNLEILDYAGEEIIPKITKYSSSEEWRVTIVPTAVLGGFVPTPGYATRVENLRALKYFPLQISFFAVSAFSNPYSVSYKVYEYDEGLLSGASLDVDQAYLQLPPEVTERTRQLALEITRGIENPYEKAKAIESYLLTNYKYNKNYTRAPAGWDPIDWFLFEAREGHCMNFNSAFVILARSVGIPARVVFGYVVDPSAEYQTVYADNSHVNAEVKFEGLGWVPFNATPTTTPTPTPTITTTPTPPHPVPGPDNQPVPGPDNQPVQRPIPTMTEITEVDSTVLKGGTFRVVGRVVDQNGNEVNGVRVVIYLMKQKGENAPQRGYGLTENGRFDITCEVPKEVEVGDYYVVAHSLGNEMYADSWSDPMIKVVSETSLLLTAPSRALVGKEFVVKGRLVEKLTGAGVTSQRVDMNFGSTSLSATTGSNGSFQIRITSSLPENCLILASFGGSSFYLPSSAEKTVEVVEPYINPVAVRNLTRGEVANVSGEVPIEGLVVQIFLDNQKVAEVASTSGGSFATSFEVTSSHTLGKATLVYLLPEYSLSRQQDVAVCARTSVELSAPSEATAGEKVVVVGVLRDDTGAPIAGKSLTLKCGDTSLQSLTDDNGGAEFQLEVPGGHEELELSVSFPGSDFYIPSENTVKIAVRQGGLPVPLFVAAVSGAVAFAVAVVLLRRRKGRRGKKPAEVEVPKRRRVSEGGMSLEVVFPSIKEPFPDVWGAGEPFRISVRLKKRGKPMEGTIRVGIDGERKEVRLPASGEWNTERKFDKGTHKVAVEYTAGKTKLVAKREARAVDYREEVVRMFNSVIASLRERGIDAEGDFTPREIQREVQARIRKIDREALDELIGIFEVANYSLREIGREEYELGYLSSEAVLGSVVKKHEEE